MEATLKQNTASLKSDERNDKPQRTDQRLAEVAGVGKDTIRNTETILTKGTPEDIKEVREGMASISGKAKEIKARDKPEVSLWALDCLTEAFLLF